MLSLIFGAYTSSQQSIQKVVGFALKFFSQCGEDLWDCIVEECQKVLSASSRTLFLLSRLDTFGKWVSVATLRSLESNAVPEHLQAEPVNRKHSSSLCSLHKSPDFLFSSKGSCFVCYIGYAPCRNRLP